MKYRTTKECDQETVNILNSLHDEYQKNDQKLTGFKQKFSEEVLNAKNAYDLAKESYEESLEKFICSEIIDEKDLMNAQDDAYHDLVPYLWNREKHNIYILEKIIDDHKYWLRHWRFEDVIAPELCKKIDYRSLIIESDECEDDIDDE